LTVPVDLPAGLLGQPVTRAFNAFYYRCGARRHARRRVHYAQYFFPLDALHDWNRLYGKAGFLQHQSVIPTVAAEAGLTEMLKAVTTSGLVSPLAVLKGLGPANHNLLSFPQAGMTLTMDFAMGAATLALFARLDDIVLAHGGRLYLAKDACMAMTTFRHGYPQWEAFQAIRERYGALGRFASLQSLRLGL
jgi:decaprenylphospho-beta-D-ribofuranose 2-oxidase